MRLSRVVASLALLAFVSCATQPATAPALTPPDTISPAVLEALCGRLRMDAIASTGALALVNVTRPLATQQSMTSLAMIAPRGVKGNRIAGSALEANRAIAVPTEGISCRWRGVAPAQLAQHQDEMLVELSAPAINPFAPKEGGLFARVTVGGEGASWYWITLVPYSGQWAVGRVSVLVQ
jgi:hypothetical protein